MTPHFETKTVQMGTVGARVIFHVAPLAAGTITFSSADWGGAVLTLKRSNDQNGPWSTLETPVTVTGDGTTETLNLQLVAFLAVEVTTAGGGPANAVLFGVEQVEFETSISVGAPSDAEFVVVSANAGLTDERTLAVGAGLSINDGGANGPITIAPDDDLAALEALGSTGHVVRTAAETYATRAIVAPAAGITVANGDGVAGNPTLALAHDLAALEGQAGTGLVARTADATYAQRTIVAPAAGVTVTDGNGVAGNPTLALANDLAALEGLGATGFAARTGADAWAQRTVTAPAAGITVTNGDGVAGNPTLALANDLAALEGLGATGLPVRTGADAWTQRSIAAGTDVSVADGDGVAGNPTVSLPSTLAANARVAVSKNSGAVVGTRRKLNLIEGSGVTLTVVDDAGNEEVDITIASTASGSGTDLTLTARNNTGSTITKGQVVCLTGSFSATVPTVALARADSASTMPAIGLAQADILNGANGTIVLRGLLSGLALGPASAFVAGQRVAVDPGTAGQFDDGSANPELIVQYVATVLAVDGGTGFVTDVYVDVLDARHLDTGTIQSDFNIGKSSTGGARTLVFWNSAGSMTQTGTPTGSRVFTWPNLTGTVVLHTTTGNIDATGRVIVSKNSGPATGTRRELNFIEGSGVTITLADDAANEEVDITIASTGLTFAEARRLDWIGA